MCALQFLIIMFLLGINVATSTGHQKANNNPLIIANTCGLVINLAWVGLAYWAVLQEHCRAAGALMALLVPCLGMPLINIVLCAPLSPATVPAAGFQRQAGHIGVSPRSHTGFATCSFNLQRCPTSHTCCPWPAVC